MRNLTRLIALLILAALGWGGYWFVGARATERGFAAWLDARAAEGWRTEVASLTTAGFPNRFDTTFEIVDLADPETGVAWEAPWFQILSLSYKPLHVIAVWPEAQRVEIPGQNLDIAAERMRGSLELGAATSLPVTRSVVELSGVDIVSSNAWTAALDAGQIALRETPDHPVAPVYDIAVSATDLALTGGEIDLMRKTAKLPDVIDRLEAELTVTFDKGWDRSALETRRPQPREIQLTALAAQWGRLALAGHGALSVDAAGLPTGEIALEATNWREMVALAEVSGALAADRVALVTRALEAVSALAGDPDRLDVTLRFAGGVALLGPLPIGLAPRFSLP